jgi:hypothetical protein
MERPMTRPQQHPDGPRQHRTRVALAALTGLIAGTTRAVADWILKNLSH